MLYKCVCRAVRRKKMLQNQICSKRNQKKPSSVFAGSEVQKCVYQWGWECDLVPQAWRLKPLEVNWFHVQVLTRKSFRERQHCSYWNQSTNFCVLITLLCVAVQLHSVSDRAADFFILLVTCRCLSLYWFHECPRMHCDSQTLFAILGV